jgi:AcrR family transcriptional regulator
MLDAALGVVHRDGAAALTLRGVARKLGVAPAAAYNHFRDKSALLAAVAEEGVRELASRMRDAASGAGSPGERLEAIGVAYVVFATSHPAHFRLLSAPDLADKRRHAGLAEAYDAAFGVLLASIEECKGAGVVKKGDTRLLAVTAWSLVHGAGWLLVDGQVATAGVDAPAGEVAHDVLRVLFTGLAPRSK